ncbi:L-asparagine permease [Salmonella enterica subsp. arizonae]|uniref:L-asparagine permease n=1 Tax=Salmonella enterica subsp. arizonae TaxID=59203 RepID=A0A379TAV0_SALER|nr:L-asparagine permease [Salmonella enterica subsp. arizonae]VDY41408.1 L-asparagine permease [Salmonella enterica subsp. arizonae]
MKKTRYTEEQIAFALKQAETDTRVGEVCRKMGISEATFYNWNKKFAGLGDDRDLRYHRRSIIYALLGAFSDVPQWVFALGALAIVGTMNMIGIKWFAEMEFWFALVKVLAIVIFLVVGTIFLGTGQPLDGNTTGFHLITDNGGFFLLIALLNGITGHSRLVI